MSYSKLAALGRRRLDAVVELAFGAQLWSIQRQIALAISRPRAKVVVPSCNASGKTFLASRLGLAFYYSFPDSKVPTTSATFDQLRSALWGEIQTACESSKVPIPGAPPVVNANMLRLTGGAQHFMAGASPDRRESFQGIHAPHKLLVVDESSSVNEEVASAINALLASGDARLLVLLNPTHSETWASRMARTPGTQVIKIRAWDTPLLACLSNEEIYDRWGVQLEPERRPRFEPCPPGASLTSPEWLDDMVAQGMGPGHPEWQTRVEAEFLDSSDTQLVAPSWYDKSFSVAKADPALRTLAIDIASYGDAENVLTYREGNRAVRQEVFRAMRLDELWDTIIKPRQADWKARRVIWDADGVGAGSFGYAEKACGKDVLLPFRGGANANSANFANMRARWYWNLRKLFESGMLRNEITDQKLREQLCGIKYRFTAKGAIKIESKQDMKRRGFPSPDRADSLMYAFVANPPVDKPKPAHPDSERGMWDREIARLDNAGSERKHNISPILGTDDWY